jgi:hypothetical protein
MAPLISPSSCSSPGAVKRFTGFTTRSDWLKEGEIRGVFRAGQGRVTVMSGSSIGQFPRIPKSSDLKFGQFGWLRGKKNESGRTGGKKRCVKQDRSRAWLYTQPRLITSCLEHVIVAEDVPVQDRESPTLQQEKRQLRRAGQSLL